MNCETLRTLALGLGKDTGEGGQEDSMCSLQQGLAMAPVEAQQNQGHVGATIPPRLT